MVNSYKITTWENNIRKAAIYPFHLHANQSRHFFVKTKEYILNFLSVPLQVKHFIYLSCIKV
jgi:hypothetical protein